MKQRLSPVSFLLMEIATLSLLSGCHAADPIESFNVVASALERGDNASALAGLTPDSAKVLRGLMSADSEHVAFPVSSLGVSTRAVSIASNAAAAPDTAYLIVEASATPPEQAIVVMKLIDGAWRLDLVETELQWNHDWTLSGGSSGGPPSWLDSPPSSIQ